MLLYVTGGAAWLNVDTSASCLGSPGNASWCVLRRTYFSRARWGQHLPGEPKRYSADAMCILASNHLLTFAKLGLSATDSVMADRWTPSMRVLTSCGAAFSA
jgi:hypothetical protein